MMQTVRLVTITMEVTMINMMMTVQTMGIMVLTIFRCVKMVLG
jgi:hypothetical protein